MIQDTIKPQFRHPHGRLLYLGLYIVPITVDAYVAKVKAGQKIAT